MVKFALSRIASEGFARGRGCLLGTYVYFNGFFNVPGSEMDEDELVSPSEDSNDSWTTAEEYSSEFILRYGVK